MMINNCNMCPDINLKGVYVKIGMFCNVSLQVSKH